MKKKYEKTKEDLEIEEEEEWNKDVTWDRLTEGGYGSG